ncbi:hypothetical protein KIPB_000061 [Kipferlia bialata]|uniref:Uncharacterized protein n=1 Tax=Kipferlia bialata TaxID=797122 RepID=A0A9K3CN06_9EUKA|nr:hypothetical protein KIPB_000061 [Kipferlia bialata]|eukprot:g61.t1
MHYYMGLGKLKCANSLRDRAGHYYREGIWHRASALYERAYEVIETTLHEDAQGQTQGYRDTVHRLRATLHSNRAACLMNLSEYREAEIESKKGIEEIDPIIVALHKERQREIEGRVEYLDEDTEEESDKGAADSVSEEETPPEEAEGEREGEAETVTEGETVVTRLCDTLAQTLPETDMLRHKLYMRRSKALVRLSLYEEALEVLNPMDKHDGGVNCEICTELDLAGWIARVNAKIQRKRKK